MQTYFQSEECCEIPPGAATCISVKKAGNLVPVSQWGVKNPMLNLSGYP